MCPKRSEFFGCIDTNSEALYRCFYPSEIEFARKTERTLKNMLDLICAYDGNDFAFYDVNGEGGQCIESKKVEIRTCANKAIYLAAKRVLEKWIESEHFKFGTEADDCM